jgi:hypothetical protein
MDYQAALSSYYASLNLLELADLVAKGGTNLLDGRQLVLSVPLCGFAIAQEVVPKAYRQLTADVDALKEIWVGVGVDTAAMARHWPAWMLQCKQWLAGVYARTGGYDGELYVEDLFGLPGLKPAAASTSNIVKP